MSAQYDLIVLGSGPGGYVAAIRGAQLGLKTAIIEAENLGGVCLNWGCIPTKALLRSAEIGRNIKHAKKYGWQVKDHDFNLDEIVGYSRDVSQKLSGGVAYLMKKNKIDVLKGWGRLKGPGVIEVTGEDGAKKYGAKHIIIATGAKARQLPDIEADGKLIVTAKDAMVPQSLPKRLLVIGSGAIGAEFASFYNELGSEVTILELQDRILPAEDEETSKLAQTAFEKQGMIIQTGAKLEVLKKSTKTVSAKIKLSDGTQSENTFDRVIVAIGIEGNVHDIGLENTKVKTEKSHIVIDEWMQTDEFGIYAIGDVAGPPWLAHKASHEAICCVEKLAGLPQAHPIDSNLVPGCTYTHPQIASVGYTEQQAKQAGHKNVRVGKFPFSANGKAIALGEPEGLIKILTDADTGEILGAHMIGTEVTELIHSIALAMTVECTEEYLLRTIFPHPTLSEMIHETTLNSLERAIHI